MDIIIARTCNTAIIVKHESKTIFFRIVFLTVSLCDAGDTMMHQHPDEYVLYIVTVQRLVHVTWAAAALLKFETHNSKKTFNNQKSIISIGVSVRFENSI